MGNKLKLLSLTAGASALSMAMASGAYAAGTAADTTVKNTFTLDYQVSGVDQPTISTCKTGDAGCTTETSTNFTVDRLIDLTVASNGDTTVAPGATDQQLVFSVTNTGNDTQGYVLSLVNEAGDDFDASGLTITYYFDDGTAGFGPGDTAGTAYTYTPGSGLATEDLPADAIIWVVVEGDIPAAPGVVDTDEADITLVADTVEPGSPGVAGVPVTADTDGNSLTGAAENVLADGSGTANEVANAGDHSATGTYIVAAATLDAAKTVSVFSEDGSGCGTIPGAPAGGYAVPGSCVEYVITVTNTGATASATGIDLSDILADELEFIAAARSAQLTGGTFSTPATNTDCTGGACTVALTGASLAAGQTGTVTIRALLQ